MLLGVVPELVRARVIGAIDPPLVQEDGENDVIPEARQAVHGRHGDDESEEVVDDRVKGLVGHHTPREVGNRLELVVQVELRTHHDESEGVH